MACVPEKVNLKNIDIWFQDEARFGQQNTISRIWALKGSRPGLIRQQQREYAYLFGAVCPEKDEGIALVLPSVNTHCLDLHLTEISRHTARGHHAVIIMDQAGYHLSSSLPTYKNLTPIYLPAYSPELNSAEQLWEWLRSHDLSNRAFSCYEDIVDAICTGWNKLKSQAGRLRSLCSRDWASLQ